MTTSDSTSTIDPFEARLRADLHRLADYAPTSVDLTVTNDATITANEPPRSRGRRVASIGAVVAVLAGGAGLTINGLQAADDPGGAATPDEAVQQFAAAFANEDLLGMAAITVPEEAKALRAAAEDGVAQAKRLDLLSETFQLDGISGLDVAIDGLTLTDRPIDDQLVAVTSTGGTMSLTLSPDAVAMGEQTRRVNVGRFEMSSATVDLAEQPLTLVAQKRGDQWYVSAGMSLAEAIVMATGEQTPVGPSIVPEGSPSPEAAATEFYTRLANIDIAGATALVAPGEGDVFRRYASLWQPPIDQALSEAKTNGAGVTITTPLEYDTVADSDGRVILKPVKYGFDFTVPEYDYNEVSMYDPTLETVVTAGENGDAYLLGAGVPLPTSADDPILDQGKFYAGDDEAAMEELYNMEDGWTERNYAWINPDGSVEVPTDSVQGDLLGTSTTHVEKADNCTTITLPAGGGDDGLYAAENMASFGMEKVGDNSYRQCGEGESAFTTLVGAFAFGGNLLPELPSIVVTDNGGEWFVSPIGTISESIIGPLRDIPDGADLVDIPLMSVMSGLVTRDQFNAMIKAEDSGFGDAPECVAITEDGPDGTRVLVAHPDLDALRACVEAGWGYDSVSPIEDSAVAELEMSAPASEVTGG